MHPENRYADPDVAKALKADLFRQRQQVLKDAQQQLLIDSLKSNLSDYALRCKQAEEFAGALLSEKLTKEELLTTLFKMIPQHLQEKANERAVHQQQILQTTALAVNSLGNMLKPETDYNVVVIREAVTAISRGLATALGNMNDFEKKSVDSSAVQEATKDSAVNKESNIDQQTTEQS